MFAAVIPSVFFDRFISINFQVFIFGIIFSLNIEKIRIFLSKVFNFELFPSDVYFLEKLPSEINNYSILVVFIFSLFISALASYLPAMSISKMKTFRALKYE